jgi:hypothetical protein
MTAADGKKSDYSELLTKCQQLKMTAANGKKTKNFELTTNCRQLK